MTGRESAEGYHFRVALGVASLQDGSLEEVAVVGGVVVRCKPEKCLALQLWV